MANLSADDLVSWLRAAGEPSRLRLLALCSQRDLSVTDLAQALGQSEPRVSRHLKILCEAGLLERLRQGQWVHYRVTEQAGPATFVQGLLAQVDRRDPVLARDRDRAQAGTAVADGAIVPAMESRLGRALRGFVEATGPQMRAGAQGSAVGSALAGSALVVGVEHPELLESAAALAKHCTVIAHSRRGSQALRAFAERHGIRCKVVLASGSDGLSERDIARAGQSFDLVLLNHLAIPQSAFAGMLSCGRRALAPEGSLWIFERYDSLETPRDRVVEHPIGKLRRLLNEAGLVCERLSPLEADGEHVLAAVAVRSQAARRSVGTAGAA